MPSTSPRRAPSPSLSYSLYAICDVFACRDRPIPLKADRPSRQRAESYQSIPHQPPHRGKSVQFGCRQRGRIMSHLYGPKKRPRIDFSVGDQIQTCALPKRPLPLPAGLGGSGKGRASSPASGADQAAADPQGTGRTRDRKLVNDMARIKTHFGGERREFYPNSIRTRDL